MTRWLVERISQSLTKANELKVVSNTTAETAEDVLRDLGWVGVVRIYRLPEPVKLKGVKRFGVEHP